MRLSLGVASDWKNSGRTSFKVLILSLPKGLLNGKENSCFSSFDRYSDTEYETPKGYHHPDTYYDDDEQPLYRESHRSPKRRLLPATPQGIFSSIALLFPACGEVPVPTLSAFSLTSQDMVKRRFSRRGREIITSRITKLGRSCKPGVKVVATSHQKVADICGFNLGSICESKSRLECEKRERRGILLLQRGRSAFWRQLIFFELSNFQRPAGQDEDRDNTGRLLDFLAVEIIATHGGGGANNSASTVLLIGWPQ